MTPPDTGTLQGDLVVLLRAMRSLFESIGRDTLLGLMTELSQPAAESLRGLLFAWGDEVLQPVLERARGRGELERRQLPPRAVTLPFDLARHELTVVGGLPDETVGAIVDDVVLPLLRALSRG